MSTIWWVLARISEMCDIVVGFIEICLEMLELVKYMNNAMNYIGL